MQQYLKIPRYVLYEGLKPTEFMVYCYLCECANNRERTCSPTRRQICECCGIKSRRTIDLCIKTLVDKNLITKTNQFDRNHNGAKANLYCIK